jgi:hypothetical protein
MRRSGRTTRLVDAAIQTLFTEGEIYIPFSRWVEDKVGRLGYSPEELQKRDRFIDWIEGGEMHNNTQIYLRNKILDRLHLEHNGQFEVYNEWIRLKKEE